MEDFFACLFQVYLKHIQFWAFIFINRAFQGITNLHLWDLLFIAHQRAADSLLRCFLSRPFGQHLHSAWWGMAKLQLLRHLGFNRTYPRHDKTDLLMVKAVSSNNLSTRSLPKYQKLTGVSWRERWGKILDDGGYLQRSLPTM